MAELSDPKIGVLIEGRYRLAERLASGGMGVVYRAERVGIGKAVAIKFLHEQFAVLPDLVKRFEREAAVMSQLSHPNLVSVIDYGVHQGAPYLVMEFHTGALLGDLIAEGPISCQRAVSITRQILSGMARAPGRGGAPGPQAGQHPAARRRRGRFRKNSRFRAGQDRARRR